MNQTQSDECGEWAASIDVSTAPLRRIWLKHQLLLMIVAALVVRLIVVLCVFRDQAATADNHAQFGWEMGWVARSISLGHGFSSPFFPSSGPTALVPPLFPYLLSGIFHFFGLYTAKSAFAILSINSLLSALTCVPIYLSARHVLGVSTAKLAGWAWVFYPYAIYFSAARVWDYALTGLLFTICFYFALRISRKEKIIAWLSFGLLYGLSVLANPSVLPMFPFLLLLAALQMRRPGKKPLRLCLAAAIGMAAVLGPWVFRTYRSLHVIRPVRDNFWLECWAGNNGDTFESNPGWAHPASNPVEMKEFEARGEIAYLGEKQMMATNFILRHPMFFLSVSARRAICYWTAYWSFNPAYLRQDPTDIPDIFFCSCITLLVFCGVLGIWREDRWVAVPYLTLILLFPVTYYVTHASPDYLQPIEPEIVVLAAVGLQRIRRTAEPAEVDVPSEREETEMAMSMITGG